MSRRARLTVLELGASQTAWASCRGLGTDDWVVVAQQRDEAAPEFTERVRQRARRLAKEDARIESVDVYTSSRPNQRDCSARRDVIEALSGQLAAGGRLTLWGVRDDPQTDAELTDILAQFAPTLALRQIALNHQTCESEPRSGIRHVAPEPTVAASEEGFAFDDFA